MYKRQLDHYRRSVGGSDWSGLPVYDPAHSSLGEARAWLSAVAAPGGPNILFSATALRLLLSALDWILKSAGEVVGLAAFGAATLIDRLAQVLYQGVLLSAEIARSVADLMAAALRFLGRTALATERLSVALVRFVVEMLFRALASLALASLSLMP